MCVQRWVYTSLLYAPRWVYTSLLYAPRWLVPLPVCTTVVSTSPCVYNGGCVPPAVLPRWVCTSCCSPTVVILPSRYNVGYTPVPAITWVIPSSRPVCYSLFPPSVLFLLLPSVLFPLLPSVGYPSCSGVVIPVVHIVDHAAHTAPRSSGQRCTYCSSILTHTVQGPLFLINLSVDDSCDVRTVTVINVRNVRTVGYTGARITSGITVLPRGNRAGKTEKPATESTCAQGTQEYEEVHSPDQTCI